MLIDYIFCRWNPPNWVFGPVWTMLYTLMGTASFLVYRAYLNENIDINQASFWYIASLILNTIWSPVFFGAGMFKVALVIMAILWYTVYQSIFYFFQIHPIASYLLYPYIAWLSLAFTLNIYIAIMNPNGPRGHKD